ncbi:enoyl-CoA hydratase/isomerase family protein [uncultured Roseobacter sp.]|uniref:enoyl-CoA hydratase/isomerase family protein n=1 Tax=uncultured Roseobacter sp. TaxID=114847 RepID=UPI002637C05C|nr:enoyl-CoA hydratase/isomerase family protein [uncultured Roseobacter sp.]
MIDVAQADGIWTVTLNRPDKANALTAHMLRDLAQTMREAQAARAVILTGAGKVFSAGADLDAVRGGLAVSPQWEELSAAVSALPGLSIAALNGTLAGGAMGMALACDLRIAVPRATFFYPVMKLGFLPQPSDPHRLAALIGPARAKLMLMAGQRLGAEEALQAGLIERIVEADALLSEARALAADAVAASPEHARQIKEMCSRSLPLAPPAGHF